MLNIYDEYHICKEIRNKLKLNKRDSDKFIYDITFSNPSIYSLFINDIFGMSIIHLGVKKVNIKYNILYESAEEVTVDKITYTIKKRGEINDQINH